jgi:hypothetical protein
MTIYLMDYSSIQDAFGVETFTDPKRADPKSAEPRTRKPDIDPPKKTKPDRVMHSYPAPPSWQNPHWQNPQIPHWQNPQNPRWQNPRWQTIYTQRTPVHGQTISAFTDMGEEEWKDIIVFGMVGIFILFAMDMAAKLKRR